MFRQLSQDENDFHCGSYPHYCNENKILSFCLSQMESLLDDGSHKYSRYAHFESLLLNKCNPSLQFILYNKESKSDMLLILFLF